MLKLAEKSNDPNSLGPNIASVTCPHRIGRQHFAVQAKELATNSPLTSSWVTNRWCEEWERVNTNLHHNLQTSSTKPSGHSLSRAARVRLNRLRTGWGKTNHFLKNIGAEDTDSCPCGAIQTTKPLIEACPISSPPNGVQGLKDLDGETIK